VTFPKNGIELHTLRLATAQAYVTSEHYSQALGAHLLYRVLFFSRVRSGNGGVLLVCTLSCSPSMSTPETSLYSSNAFLLIRSVFFLFSTILRKWLWDISLFLLLCTETSLRVERKEQQELRLDLCTWAIKVTISWFVTVGICELSRDTG